MSKHGKEKVRRIKAIPNRQIDFYYRLQNSPQQQRRRRKRRILEALVLALTVGAAAVWCFFKNEEKEYQEKIAVLEAFLEDETNAAANEEAKSLQKQVEKQEDMILDLENVTANIRSYPLVTSDVFRQLEDCCPDKVSITITGYSSLTGELQFDAVAPDVTDVSQVIETWKTLDIFQSVSFTGYTQNRAQDGYTVKVVCILSETAGRQADDEN